MTGFVVGALVTLALTLAVLLRPFYLRQSAAATASQRQLNTAILREQLAKLEQDLAEGTLGVEDYGQARATRARPDISLLVFTQRNHPVGDKSIRAIKLNRRNIVPRKNKAATLHGIRDHQNAFAGFDQLENRHIAPRRNAAIFRPCILSPLPNPPIPDDPKRTIPRGPRPEHTGVL